MSLTSFILKFAAPIPQVESFDRYLFVGPHPDDIEIGAGATIAKLVEAKKKVAFLICLDGRYGDGNSGGLTGDVLAVRRREEAVASAAVLGVKDIYFLGRDPWKKSVLALTEEQMRKAEPLCDGGFYSMDDMIQGIASAIDTVRPDIVFAPDHHSQSECHIDHLNVGQAVSRVACFAPYAGILARYLPGRVNEEAEAVSVKAIGFYMTAKPNWFVRTTRKQLETQFDSIAEHHSQYPDQSGELESIKTYLKLRSVNYGLRKGGLHGEGFRVLGTLHMHCLPEAGL